MSRDKFDSLVKKILYNPTEAFFKAKGKDSVQSYRSVL